MPDIILKNVTKRFRKSAAVDHLNMEIRDGSFVTLLGPSGCGKTTTLRMIAGLETPTEGEIRIGDQLVFSAEKGIDLTADKRGIGFLFQNYALWPHMTVSQNIAFGLENLKWKKDAVKERVEELLDTLQIREYAGRYPAELSGGQQQRVAIARTLATKPAVLLMDEPLSNLDAKLRLDMRTELKRLHLDTRSTFIYVTHDQQEAMALSTDICLMKNGLLQQYCGPLELYERPANRFVADFVGSPSINFVEFDCEEGRADIMLRNSSMRFAFRWKEGETKRSLPPKVVAGIRLEFIRIVESGGMKAEVYSCFPSGMETMVILSVGRYRLSCVVFGNRSFPVGQEVRIEIMSDSCALFDGATQERVAMGALEIAE